MPPQTVHRDVHDAREFLCQTRASCIHMSPAHMRHGTDDRQHTGTQIGREAMTKGVSHFPMFSLIGVPQSFPSSPHSSAVVVG